MTCTQKIGLYGGSFDPIHYGHMRLIETALRALGLDKVLIMPSGAAAHYKSVDSLTPAEHRLEMIRLALGERPEIEISTYEIDQGRFCYTINTLRDLRAQSPPSTQIFLLVGGDWIDRIPTWHEGEAILREFQVAAFSRPGFQCSAHRQNQRNANIHYISMPMVEASSSRIREKLRRGESIASDVPPAVEDYIHQHGFYKG